MSNISTVTYNCHGLNDLSKRQKLFSWSDSQEFDVILLQETFCTKTSDPHFKAGWKGNSFFVPSDSSHSRGVAILFRLGFEGDILNKKMVEFLESIWNIKIIFKVLNQYMRQF